MNMPTPNSFSMGLTRGVATITLDRPKKLNALTFEVYRELSETFEALSESRDVRAVVITGRDRAFCSGGDVSDIIAELFSYNADQLLSFTRLTGRLIQAMREVRRPVIGALHGVAVGAGAVMAAACDIRIAAQNTRFGFIFPQVGLSGADMGASYLLPRIVGLGNASELLFTGKIIDVNTAYRMGLVNEIVEDRDTAVQAAQKLALELARGPAFAHAMTKKMLEAEANMSLSEAIEAEAQAQALCMAHPDFQAAHVAYTNKTPPKYAGVEICNESE
jgi:enoyl-CoA hydratase/carnithine racemase